MKAIKLICWKLFSCLSFLLNGVKRIVWKGRSRKESEGIGNAVLPSDVYVHHGDEPNQQMVNWQDWGGAEEFSVKVESPNPTPVASSDNMNLFEDMQPVFKKPKRIVVKKQAPEYSNNHLSTMSSRLNFDARYTPLESELGAWSEEAPSAWDEGVSEHEIVSQTESVLRENKQAERERRALEQQKKREEKEAQRAARKPASHLGTKVAS